MANRKISELAELTLLAEGDYFPVVDISEPSDTDKNKRISALNLGKGAQDQTSGAAFPSQPAYGSNRPFYRTDLGWWCYYDDPHWLTCHTYTTFWTAVGFTASGTFSPFNPLSTQTYAPYIVRVTCGTNVVAPNDGTKYWSLILYGYNLTNTTNSYIHSLNTSADTAGVKTDHGATTMSGTAVPTSGWSLVWHATKTSTPGGLTLEACVEYRLIIA